MNLCGGGRDGSLRAWFGKVLYRIWYPSREDPATVGLLHWLRASSMLYGKLCRRRQNRVPAAGGRQRLPVPVISVGNLVVGGTGKTPLTMWLASYLRDQGISVAVLSRGYGRSVTAVARVVLGTDSQRSAREFGDEPVLMASRLSGIPIWVGRHRSQSGELAIGQDRAQLLILDDGFQHWALDRDLDVVLVDASSPWGNGYLLPLGPLREPVEHLERAHVILITQRQKDLRQGLELRGQLERRFPRKPIFSCRFCPSGLRWGLDGPAAPVEILSRHPAVVFAGIGKPESFFQTVQQMGIRSALNLIFPDHHFYRHEDVKRIVAPVAMGKARWLLTTEKDAVRLPPSLQDVVVTLGMEADFGEDHDAFTAYLAQWWDQTGPGEPS